MRATLTTRDWLSHVRREYLTTFIRDGGGAVKFAVPMEGGLRMEVLDGLAAAGDETGYLVAMVNAAETKLHMVDEIFFRAASQVPWEETTRKVLAKLVQQAGYKWTEAGSGPLCRRIAEHNGIDTELLVLDVKRTIGERTLRRPALARDFRVAMAHLCIAELMGGPAGEAATGALTAWLSGVNRAASAVKEYQIFRKITRASARHMMESLARWIRFAGYSGLLLLVDAQRVMTARNPHDNGLYYSRAAVMDCYEVLRQFIDGADRMEGCLIAVVPDSGFLEDESRGVSAYEALKFRVYDEVHDKHLANPMAALTRIAGTAQA